MHEAIRLLVWDLDGVFWRGTLTEGGIELRDDTRQIVIGLARRGIMSSICSKNDFETVRAILLKAGIWDYFIFPSIQWSPKGPRIAKLIERVQLRPSTVLFLDDNPINLEEAKHFTPELQVDNERFIEKILDHEFFKGKDDPDLTRLKQYKSLQLRKTEENAAGADIEKFLRQSNIRVSIDFDVSSHIDRAVELINRTNQLNFTKRRLPQDSKEAVAALQDLIRQHDIQAGLVRVLDRYGDHGYCGIYVLKNSMHLLHFAFSCRILGMGVETWLWRRLGRPELRPIGQVLTNVHTDRRALDWIQLEQPGIANAASADSPKLARRIVAHGGCDLQTLCHYFGVLATDLVGEFNTNRRGLDARVDHSLFLRYSAEGLDPASVAASAGLGYEPQDFHSALLEPVQGPSVWMLSLWTDAAYAIYRHRTLGFHVPFAMMGNPDHRSDARLLQVDSLDEIRADPQKGAILAMLSYLKDHFDYVGAISKESFQENLNSILVRAPPDARIFIVEANEYLLDANGDRESMPHTVRINEWTREVSRPFPMVHLVNIRDFVLGEHAVQSPFHFDRMVYFRMFNHILAALTSDGDARKKAEACLDGLADNPPVAT